MSNKEKALEILEKHIENFSLDYADNFRVANMNSQEEMDAFEEQSMNGCCGSYETEIEINGETWMIGCNYGH